MDASPLARLPEHVQQYSTRYESRQRRTSPRPPGARLSTGRTQVAAPGDRRKPVAGSGRLLARISKKPQYSMDVSRFDRQDCFMRLGTLRTRRLPVLAGFVPVDAMR